LEVTVTVRGITRSINDGISLHFTFGRETHTVYQIYFRFFYSVFEFAALVALLRRTGAAVSAEQGICAAVAVIVITANNQLYALHVCFPRVGFVVLEAIAVAVSRTTVLFAVVLMCDAAVYRADHPSCIGPSVALLIVSYGADALVAALTIRRAFALPVLVENRRAALADGVQTVVKIALAVCAVSRMLWNAFPLAGRTYKWIAYAVMALAVVAVESVRAFASIGTIDGRWYEFEWVAWFVASNTFTLANIYWHWPVKKDSENLYGQVKDSFERSSEMLE
jgi:hypothetical protein